MTDIVRLGHGCLTIRIVSDTQTYYKRPDPTCFSHKNCFFGTDGTFTQTAYMSMDPYTVSDQTMADYNAIWHATLPK